MSYRSLLWVTAVAATAALLLASALGPSLRPLAIHAVVELAKLAWLVAAVAAARAFEPGDYLRRAWGMIALAVGLFLLRDALQIPSLAAAIPSVAVGGLEAVLVVLGNAAQVWGVWLIARVWSAVGLDDAVRGRGVLFVAAVALAALIVGPSMVHDVASVAHGSLASLPHLASDLGDAASFLLLAALVRTVLAVRGGVIFWTWLPFALGELAWMLFDGARTLAELAGASTTGSPLVECPRVLGALYFVAAAVAQRWIVSARFPVDERSPRIEPDPGDVA